MFSLMKMFVLVEFFPDCQGQNARKVAHNEASNAHDAAIVLRA